MGMRCAEVRIADGGLVAEMTRMRVWLDSCRFEPSVFRYEHVDGGVVIHVEFAIEQEAAAFAQEFGGQLVR
jgi:hypothetical protein